VIQKPESWCIIGVNINMKISEKGQEILEAGAKMFHVKHFSSVKEKFIIYYDELLVWNRRFNLTGIKNEKEIIIKHFLDSLSLVQFLDFDQPLKVIDIGSGAGFPGIPIYICFPNLQMYLNESNGKKVSFLRHICKELFPDKPPVILHGRAEEVIRGSSNFAGFDVVMARAVGKAKTVANLAFLFLRPGGVFLAQYGPKEEVNELNKEIRKLNGHVEQTHKLVLPFSDYSRQVCIIKKNS
jgi:16S rRNA (guanine527-N7)-methyltransferase